MIGAPPPVAGAGGGEGGELRAQGLKSSPRGACREQLLRSCPRPAGPRTRRPRWLRRRPRPPWPVLPTRARRLGRGVSPGARRAGPAAPRDPDWSQPPRGLYPSGLGPRLGFAGPRDQFLKPKDVRQSCLPRPGLCALCSGRSSHHPQSRELHCNPQSSRFPLVSPTPAPKLPEEASPCEGVSHTCADQVSQCPLCVCPHGSLTSVRALSRLAW